VVDDGMGRGGALEHVDAVGDRFEVAEGSVGGLTGAIHGDAPW
jgi:hypothetical protein